jgi:enoyl-CoA hydratase/carnithine racemase
MLLASSGFRAWRAATPRRDRPEPDRPRVRLSEVDGVLHLELDRPDRRNAMDARMRDELCEGLDTALIHPDQPRVLIRGRGPDFSAGGDLDEFGTAPDPGDAHLVRLLRSPAQRLHALGERAEVRLHGACIGAGIEIPAAAGRVVAQANARFRLPEVAMGLIPGAGGTATLPRRIGRHRTCYMALSGAEIDAAGALAWGMVDEIAT